MGLFFDDKPGKKKVSKNMDLDSELSFDYDDLNDLDMFDEGKSRTPIEKFKSGIKRGADNALSNPATYKKLVLDALPDEYEVISKEVDRRYKDLNRIYKSTTGALKEELSSLSEQVEKLVPEDQGVTRKLYDSTLGKFKRTKTTDNERTERDFNQEQLDQTLKEIFKKQTRADKRKEAIDSIRTGLTYKGTLDSIELLSSIDSNTSALRSYQDSVTQAYQKKSLELQYRSYFVQAELLKKFSEYSQEDLAIGKSVIKNTALPDFVKATDSEKIGDVFMTKFGDKVYGKLFDNNFIGNLTKTLADKAGQIVEQIQAGVFAATSAVDMIDDPSSMVGEVVGGAGVSIVQNTVSKITKDLMKKMPKTSEFLSGTGKKIHNAFITNPEGYVQDLVNNKLGFNPNDGSVKGFLKEFFSDVLSTTISGTSNSLEDSRSVGDLNKPSVYSNRAHISITEVIPGYLGKMLRELVIIRTGDTRTPDTLYDYTTNKFTTSKQLAVKYTNIVRDRLGSPHRNSLDSITNIVAPSSKGEVRSEIRNFFSKISQDKMVYTPENILNSDHYSNLSEDAKGAVGAYLNSIKGIGSKSGDFERRVSGIRNSLMDPRSTFEEAITSGHGDVLESLGLINKNESGLYEYNIDNFIKETISDSEMGKAKREGVINRVGRGFSGILGNRFNRARNERDISRGSRISTEEIKDLLDNHLSELNQNIGTVKIDTESIDSGFTTVVNRLDTIIQKITDINVRGFGSGVYNDLKGINYNKIYQDAKGIDYTKITELYNLLKSYRLPNSVIDTFITAYTEGRLTYEEIVDKATSSFEDFKDFTSDKFRGMKSSFTNMTIGDILNSIGSGIKGGVKGLWNFATSPSNLFGDVSKTVMKTGKGIFDFVSDTARETKDPIYGALKSIFGTMLEFSKNALEVGKDLLFNKLPIGIQAGYDKIKSLASTVNKFYLSTDVYVKGETEPRLKSRLLRNGYYILRDTGEPIFSFKDIKGTIIDPDGNVILDTEDINLGLVDKDGNELSTPFERLLSATGSFVKKGFNRVSKFFNNFEFSVPNFFDIFSYHNDKVVNVLVEIRDILLAKFAMSSGESGDYGSSSISSPPNGPIPGGSGTSDVFNRTKSDLISTGGIKGLASRFRVGLSGLFKGKGEDVTDVESTSRPNKLRDSLLHVLGTVKDKGSSIVDRTRNTFKDRLSKIDEENKDRHKFVETEVKSRYDSEGDGLLGTVKNIFGYIKDFFSTTGFAGFLGRTLSKIPVLGPLLGKLGSMFGLGGVGDLVGPPRPSSPSKGLISGIRNIGSKAMSGLGAVAGFGVKNLARGALALGGLGLSGIASAATSTLTATIGTMGAIGASILSPIGLATIGTGLVAYGVYKTYKYLTDGNLDDYEKIRYLQYGFDPENETHKVKISTIGSVEEYLMDEGIQITRDSVSLAPNVDAKKLLEIAGVTISEDNTETYTRFTNWFNSRFKPIFLKHCIAVNKAKQGTKLKDIKSLSDNEKATYLSLVTDGVSNVYSYFEPPYQDMDPLINKHVMIDLLVKRLLLDLKKNGTKVNLNNIDKLKKEIATKETQQKLANQTQVRVREQQRAAESTPITTPTDNIDRSTINRSSVASRTNIYAVATNDNTTIPEGDGSSNETSVKLDGLGNVPISKELRVALGPLRDGSMASKYITVSKSSVTLDGMDPTMARMLTGMIEEYGDLTGKKVIITDGFRTYQEQARLYARDPRKAAPPGRSLHEFGLAVDIDRRNLNEMDSLGLMRKYGFTRPVGGEPWHMEPAGIQGDINRAKQDIGFRNQAISSSLGKGGGGYGTMTSSITGRRNDAIARSLFIANAVKVDASSVMDGSKDTSEPYSTKSNPTPIATFSRNENNQWSLSTPTDSKVTDGSTINETPNNLDEAISKDLTNIKADPNIISAIDNASQRVGVDTNKMLTLAAVESDFKPNARAGTSSAKGLFQFIDSTYKETAPKVGLAPNSNPNDPYNSALVGAKYTKDNETMLGNMGIGTGTFESYVTHFLGPGGARTLLRSSNTEIAANILPAAAKANKSIFYDNGSPRTVQGVKEEIRRRLVSKAKAYNIPLDKSLSSSGNVGIATSGNVPSTSSSSMATPASDNSPIYSQPPRPSFRVDNAITPVSVSTRKAEIDTTSENYSKVIASAMDVSISLQESMLGKLTSIDNTLLKALTDIVTANNKSNNDNRYKEELKPSINMTRHKAT